MPANGAARQSRLGAAQRDSARLGAARGRRLILKARLVAFRLAPLHPRSRAMTHPSPQPAAPPEAGGTPPPPPAPAAPPVPWAPPPAGRGPRGGARAFRGFSPPLADDLASLDPVARFLYSARSVILVISFQAALLA